MMIQNSVAKRILVTDDEEDSRWALTTLLKREGFEPVVAQDGTTALKIMREEDLDAAVVDMKMPKISGLKVLEEVRRSGLKTPIILITAFADVSCARKSGRERGLRLSDETIQERRLCADGPYGGRKPSTPRGPNDGKLRIAKFRRTDLARSHGSEPADSPDHRRRPTGGTDGIHRHPDRRDGRG